MQTNKFHWITICICWTFLHLFEVNTVNSNDPLQLSLELLSISCYDISYSHHFFFVSFWEKPTNWKKKTLAEHFNSSILHSYTHNQSVFLFVFHHLVPIDCVSGKMIRMMLSDTIDTKHIFLYFTLGLFYTYIIQMIILCETWVWFCCQLICFSTRCFNKCDIIIWHISLFCLRLNSSNNFAFPFLSED